MERSIVSLFIRNLINFIIILIPVIFWQKSMDPFGPVQLSVAGIFIPVLAALFFIKARAEGRAVLAKSPFLFPLAAYIAVNAISVIFSLNTAISLKYIFELIIFISGGWLIYSMSSKTDIKRIIFMILASHTLISCYGIMQHFGMDVFSWNTDFAGRPMGTIGNPDFFAGHMLLPVFILAAYSLFGKKYRKIAVLALVINLICFYFTMVIGAFIGFGAGAAALGVLYYAREKEKIRGFLKRNRGTVVIVVLGFVIACAAVFISPVKEKFSDYYTLKKRSLVHRLLMWESSLLMVKDAPVFGKGAGSYRLNYPLYQAKLINDPENREYDYVVTWMPHQNYLLIAAETGILGLGMFLLLIVSFYFVCYDIFIRKKKLPPYAAGILCGITALLGASFFNTFYNIAGTTLYFFLFIFILGGYRDGENVMITGKNTSLPGLVIIIAVILFSAVSYGKILVSNIYLKEANKMSRNNRYHEAIGYYQRIISLKPVELTPQTDVGYFYYAAEAYRNIGDLKNAEFYYRKDLLLNPYCPEVNNMLGAVSGQLGNIEEAIKRLELAVYTAPHYDAAFTNLATAYVAAKEYEKAEKALIKYMEFNGESEKFTELLRAVRKEKQSE